MPARRRWAGRVPLGSDRSVGHGQHEGHDDERYRVWISPGSEFDAWHRQSEREDSPTGLAVPLSRFTFPAGKLESAGISRWPLASPSAIGSPEHELDLLCPCPGVSGNAQRQRALL